MLDIAAEQPDTELLLQKHFTALLSSVWKMTHRNERQKKFASSLSLVFGGRFFNSVNQISHISVKEPTERMKWQNSRLLGAILHDVGSWRHDDRASPSNHRMRQQDDRASSSSSCFREDASVNAERLEVTLEFEREIEDTLDPLPSFLNLSIIGSDPPSSLSRDENEDHHLRSSYDVAENRFR